MRFETSGDDTGPGADAEQRNADGQSHGQHRTERHDQDHDREGQADQFRLRRLERAERSTTDLDLHAIDRRQDGDDLLTDRRRLGLVDVGVEVQLGVGDVAGLVDLAGAEGAVRAGERDAIDGVDLGEQLGHLLGDRRVVHALLGLEHDVADLPAAALTGEVLAEDAEPLGTLRLGDGELAVVGSAHQTLPDDGHADEEEHPGDDGLPVMLEAPSSEASEHGESSGGS